jgi:ferredoxin--NADP+ reductase
MPDFPDIYMNLVRPSAPVIGKIVSNASCMHGKSASFVNHTVIDIAGTPLAGKFRAGQSFGIIPPGVDERGKAHKVRLYSVANPSWGEDGVVDHVSTTPKRLIDEFRAQRPGDDTREHSLFLGVASNYLCDLRPGDEVLVTGPQGKRFLLPAEVDQHNYLFIATGTGIAPFRGMALELLAGSKPSTSRIDLIMGTPYTSDLLYDDLFRQLADKFENFNYHIAISRESDPQYVGDVVESNYDYFEPLLSDDATLLYLCGLEGMQHGVFDALRKRNLADGYFVQKGTRLKPTTRAMLEVY